MKSQGYEITSRRGEVVKYTLEKSRLYGGTETIPYQQAWGVQKAEPDKYLGKEIIVYGFTVKNHPLEKVYKQSNGTNIYIMLSESKVIGGYSFPNADVLGALYSLDGKTLEEVTGLSFQQWQKNWKDKYGPLTSQVESTKDETSGSSAKTDLTTVNKAQTIAVPQDADVPNVTVFEKDKIEKSYYTSAIIQETMGKQGPGNNYNDLIKLPYGRLVYIDGIFKSDRDWYLASLVPAFGSMEGQEPLRQFWVRADVIAPGTQVSISFDKKFPLSELTKYHYAVIGDTSQEYEAFTRQTPDEKSPLVQPMGDGNLISVVRKDKEWSLVMKFNGSAMMGISDVGWIKNDSYREYKSSMKVTQGFVLHTTKMYENPDVNSRQFPTQNLKSAILPVNILKIQNGWTYISSGFNGLALWVKSNEVRYSFTADELFKIENPTTKN